VIGMQPTNYKTSLRELREKQNLTIEELGTKASVPANTISAIEEGSLAPSQITGNKLAKGLGVGPHEIDEVVRSAIGEGHSGSQGPR
jgi:transcriptional regulator with XRE-family HTH domain